MKIINKNVAIEYNPQPGSAQGAGKKSFSHILAEKQKGIKFSEHARARLKDRQIELSEQDHELINRAVDRAAEKGARESLLLLHDLALIVSVRNRTVITAMEQHTPQEKVFTNIDSAVIIE